VNGQRSEGLQAIASKGKRKSGGAKNYCLRAGCRNKCIVLNIEKVFTFYISFLDFCWCGKWQQYK